MQIKKVIKAHKQTFLNMQRRNNDKIQTQKNHSYLRFSITAFWLLPTIFAGLIKTDYNLYVGNEINSDQILELYKNLALNCYIYYSILALTLKANLITILQHSLESDVEEMTKEMIV